MSQHYPSEVSDVERALILSFSLTMLRESVACRNAGSQGITPMKSGGREIEFRAELTGLEEITRWVLSHGRHAKVIGPGDLKRRVKAVLHQMQIAAV